MASAFSIPCAICFILMYLIISNVAYSEFRESLVNTTEHASTSISGRAKRSLSDRMPEVLTLRMKYATGEEVDLKWIKTYQYLANEHLPVITLLVDLHLNVMYDFGEFLTYQDVETCSAVVYFEKLNAFYGVIGMNYYIEALPYDFDETGVYRLMPVGEPYVQKTHHAFDHIYPNNVLPPPSDNNAWLDYIHLPNYNSDQSRKRPSDCQPDSSTKHKRTKRDFDEKNEGRDTNADEIKFRTNRRRRGNPITLDIYLEILVFITRDIAELFKLIFGEDYIHWIIRHHIVYFNAVDVIFKKLRAKDTIIHINVAKIVIEDVVLLPFDFISDDNIQFTDLIDKLPQYLDSHSLEYVPDSFDHVFIHTRRTIMDDIVPVNGLSRYGGNLYMARKSDQFNNVVPITIVEFKSSYADYVIAVHEIGRTFNMEMEHGTEGLESIGQCHSIMQREGPKCINCLKWSKKSLAHFATFRSVPRFSQNRNICFLLNKPRSLRHPGASVYLSPHRQCRCFGYDSYITGRSGRVLNTVRIHECAEPLRCKEFHQSEYYESTVRPFDGTPCATGKVCWDKKCREIES